jgi:asparagine synthase (glutamine-hydrolysing)
VNSWFASLAEAPGGPRLRLSVDAPSTFLSNAESDTCTLIFDGWLYNRTELLARFAPLLSAEVTDAALALQAYLRWGDEALHRLEGIFSFCLWDFRRKVLFCARDPLGIYPLFYARAGHTWLFSTSVDTLLQHPLVPNTLDRRALVAYLLMRGRDIEETFFSNVRRLPPGHALKTRYGAEGAEVYRYWNPVPNEQVQWTREEELEGFTEVMTQAVGRCLQLGQAGVFLSGGLDSGTVATFATEQSRKQGLPDPRAYSLAYHDDEANEERVQRGIAGGLGIPQTFIRVDRTIDGQDLFSASLELNRTWPNPPVSGFLSPYVALGRRAQEEGCACILTGDGGDEWLSVHHALSADFIRSRDVAALRYLWEIVRAASSASRARVARHLLWSNGLRLLLVDNLGGALQQRAPQVLRPHRRRLLERDLPAWLAPDPELRAGIYAREERLSERAKGSFYQREILGVLNHPLTVMYAEENFEIGRRVGVPVLRPFYDPEVIAFLVRTPPHLRSRGGRYKGLLRGILHQRFPQLGYDRQQKPYGTNFFALRVLEGAQRMWPVLKRGSALAELGVIDAAGTDTFMTETFTNERLQQAKRLWMLLNSEAWVQSRSRSPRAAWANSLGGGERYEKRL